MLTNRDLLMWAQEQVAQGRGLSLAEIVAKAYLRGGIDALAEETRRITREGHNGQTIAGE